MPDPSPVPELEWAVVAARAADSKAADDVVVLEVGPVMAVCEHFVIASGSNTRQVRTIAEEVEEQLKLAGGPKPIRMEGFDDLRWVLLDYGDFVVHVFLDETRRYYDLERLWSDVPRVAWADPDGPASAVPSGPASGGAS